MFVFGVFECLGGEGGQLSLLPLKQILSLESRPLLIFFLIYSSFLTKTVVSLWKITQKLDCVSLYLTSQFVATTFPVSLWVICMYLRMPKAIVT